MLSLSRNPGISVLLEKHYGVFGQSADQVILARLTQTGEVCFQGPKDFTEVIEEKLFKIHEIKVERVLLPIQ